jgi:hypothetical protein
MDSVYFKTCDWSQVSRRCPWRFHAVSKSKQPIPVQPFVRAFEGVRKARSVQQIELKTSRRQSNTVQTLGQAFSISTRSWISEVDTVWKVFARCLDYVATRPDTVQHFRIFQCSVRTQKWVLAKTVQTLGQAVRTYTCYGKIWAILKGGRRIPSGRG